MWNREFFMVISESFPEEILIVEVSLGEGRKDVNHIQQKTIFNKSEHFNIKK